MELLPSPERPDRPSSDFEMVYTLLFGSAVASLFSDYKLLSIPLTISAYLVFVRYRRALQKFEKANLDWQIRNARGWVQMHKKHLAEGHPWFDDEEDWEFKTRHALENWRSTLEDLEGRRKALETS